MNHNIVAKIISEGFLRNITFQKFRGVYVSFFFSSLTLSKTVFFLIKQKIDKMMDDLGLLSFSTIISGQWVGDDERLCAMEHHLWLKRFLPSVELEPKFLRLAGQVLTLLHSEWPKLYGVLAILSAIGLIHRASRAPKKIY